MGFKIQIVNDCSEKKTLKTNTVDDEIKQLASELKSKITLFKEEIKQKDKTIKNYFQIVPMTKKEYQNLTNSAFLQILSCFRKK